MTHLTKIVFLTLLLATLAHALQAQQRIPGFMGKRFFLEVQASPTSYYRAFGATGAKPKSPITLAPKISLNYATSRKGYFSLEAEQHIFNQVQDYVSDLSIFGVEEVEMRTTIRRIGIGIYTTLRKRNEYTTLSPLGRYFGYRLYYGQLESEPTNFTASNSGMEDAASEYYNLNYENPSHEFLGINVAWGNRTMLNESISFQLGLDLGYHFIVDPEYYSDFDKKRLFFESDLNTFGGLTIAIQIGLGVLLF